MQYEWSSISFLSELNVGCGTGRYQCSQRSSATYCNIGVKILYTVVNIWQWCRWELILLIKLRFSSPGKGNLSRLWLSCLGSFVLFLTKLKRFFGFPIFNLFTYLMKFIPETNHATKYDIYVFLRKVWRYQRGNENP